MSKKKVITVDELDLIDQIAISIAGNSYNVYNDISRYIDIKYYKESYSAKDVLEGLVEYINKAKRQTKQYLKRITKDRENVDEQKKCAKKSKSK